MSAPAIIASIITGGTNQHTTVSEEANAVATDFVGAGILGSLSNSAGVAPAAGSFAINQDSSVDMGVTIKGTGNTPNGQSIAYILGAPTGQGLQSIRARMSTDYTSYTINANSSGATRYDWIYLSFSAANAENPDVAADNVVNLFTSRSTSSSSDNGQPPTYGILLAVVTVVNGATSITNGNISDRRSQVIVNIGSTSSTSGWQSLGFPLSYGANNGGKEFTATSANDLRGFLSVGMKVQVSRSITPPSECMAFASGSSQYATKSSPTGLSFTSAFTIEAWIKPLSYTTNVQTIGGRTDNATGGFSFEITTGGQLRVYYGATSSFTDFITAQSIRLNEWTHVCAVITSTSSKTAILYINGTAVTASSSTSGASSLAQAGNLSVGGRDAGISGTFFNGYISEFRVWSVAQTATAVQTNMGISLVGTETNLVTLIQGNGNVNDATTNANNLTLTGGAIATQADNPYNVNEFARIRAITYSNPTTTLVLYTGDYGTIPNQTLNDPLYSNVAEPLDFPDGITNIMGVIIWTATQSNTSTTDGTQLQGATMKATLPATGKRVKMRAYCYDFGGGSAGVITAYNGAQQVAEGIVQGAALMIETAPFWAPGGLQTFSLNMFSLTSGTADWNSLIGAPSWFTLEEA